MGVAISVRWARASSAKCVELRSLRFWRPAECMGHIDSAAPVTHIWYFKGVPSPGHVLNSAPADSEKVPTSAAYITEVDAKGARRTRRNKSRRHDQRLRGAAESDSSLALERHVLVQERERTQSRASARDDGDPSPCF